MTAQTRLIHRYSNLLFSLFTCLLTSLIISVVSPSIAWSAVTSDDFNTSSLNTSLWRIHDPLGDAVVSLVGTGSADARLSIAVPAGPSHDPWTTDTAPRLLQTVGDGDFSVELKFDSSLTRRYQGQGLIVQEDDDTWLRFDLYSNGSDVYVYSAARSGGVMSTKINSRTTLSGSTLYLKVERSGTQWTQAYSADGVNWSTAGTYSYLLNVTELGPFAGNFSSSGNNAPAHTALVDYLFNSASPIVPEDGEPAPQVWPVSTSVIGDGSIVLDPADGNYADGSVVSVTALPDVGWTFTGWSGDLSGNFNPESLLVDAAKAVTAHFAPEPVAPTISNVQVNAQLTGATVTWTTDVPANSKVVYGETAGYGSIMEDAALVTSHSLQLTSLTPGTTYHYQVSSGNAVGTVTTQDMTFATPAQVWPVSTSVNGNGSIVLNPAGGSYSDGTVVSVTAAADTGWVFDGWSGDLNGSINPESLLVDSAKSITAIFTAQPVVPTITNVQVSPLPTEATVTWTTDVPASSRLEYGETPSYGTVIDDLAEVTAHSVVAVGLTPGMLYHYRVYSANDAGSAQSTTDLTFTTPADPPSGAVVSDDFSSSTLNTSLWRTHDPLGDTVVSLVGAGTTDARLSMAVPAGPSHDPWTTDTAPRLLQSISDDDFSVELKFDSLLTQKYQGQGLMVQQDDNTWLRFDLYTNGSSIYAYSASKNDGAMSVRIKSRTSLSGSPLYLKVDRSVHQWTLSYSANGDDWTTAGSFNHVLNVTEIGPFASNFDKRGNAPAHTALVDYFFNTDSPVIPEDGGSSPQLWPVSTNVIGNGSLVLNPAGSSYPEGTVVGVTATADAGWTFSGWSGDLSGNANPESLLVDSAKSVTATFVSAPVAPTISNVQASAQANGATVTWTTDVPADSRVDYGETNGYGSTVEETSLVTGHSLQLTGLNSNTTYHYRVISANAVGADTTADLTLTTQPAPGSSGIISDDFNSANLDQSLWSLVDPLGDAVVVMEGAGSGDAHLLFSVPGGQSHDPWVNNEAARLMQPANNVDFIVDVKFNSQLLAAYQDQGVLVEQDEDDWLRFDFYSDGSNTHVYAASQTSGVMNSRINSVISSGVPLYLRVIRNGNLWRQHYSYDGLNWLEAGSFSHTLAVTAVGPFVGNYDSGNNAPAHTAIIDYFFNAEAPVVPEDGVAGGDTQPPLIQQLSHAVSPDSLLVTWSTDEPATGHVEYGLTPGLELGSTGHQNLLTVHSVTVTGLSPDTDYYYRVVSADAAGNSAASSPTQISTPVSSGNGPDINIWYGLEQTFGQIGLPQRYINILGNVSSSATIASLTYALNGGSEIPLTVGPDGLRLADQGDFNIDIDVTALQFGANNVQIKAEDDAGYLTIENVQVNFVGGTQWPQAYTINWDSAADISDVAQVVDGRWILVSGGVRTSQVGYDRLIAIGDIEWDNYEVTVPITVHSIQYISSNPPAVGVISRWTGHFADGQQPAEKWWPLGVFGMYRYYLTNPSLRLYDREYQVIDSSGLQLQNGVQYMFKLRTETVAGSTTDYKFKVWPASVPEPSSWTVTYVESGDLEMGSLLLVAHYVDATFGDVIIVPLN